MTVAKDVYDCVQDLRDFINYDPDVSYRLQQGPESWFKLCSAMDVLEDSYMAISGYQGATFNQNKLGELYLCLYGLFQVLVVQQDAVVSVYESLEVPFDKRQDLKPVDDIRQTRHDAFGHPTDRVLSGKPKGQGKRYCQVVQATMEKSSFQLNIVNPTAGQGEDKYEFRDIDTLDMVRRQQEFIVDKLNRLVEKLKKEHDAYRKKFNDKPLSEAFPKSLGYHLGKVSECVEDLEQRVIGIASLNIVCDSLKKLEGMLKERELGLDTYPSIEYLFKELEHPLNQLRRLFSQKVSGEELDRLIKDCEVFARFVRSRIAGAWNICLKECVAEIDSMWGTD